MTFAKLALGFWAVLLCSCAEPYFFPESWIDVNPPLQENDAERVKEAALSVGFVFKGAPNVQTELAGLGPATGLLSWEWPAHNSVHIALLKISRTNSYRILFSDSRTPGLELIGPPCMKYMEFVASLKRQFGTERSRLRFYTETCNPNATDPYGEPFRG